MVKLTPKDIREVHKLRSSFPNQIRVRVHRSEDGGFCAEILTYAGSFTEANTFSELMEMLNDAVATYFDVPEKYLSYMPSYVPPISLAKALNVFPVRETEKEIELTLLNREGANR